MGRLESLLLWTISSKRPSVTFNVPRRILELSRSSRLDVSNYLGPRSLRSREVRLQVPHEHVDSSLCSRPRILKALWTVAGPPAPQHDDAALKDHLGVGNGVIGSWDHKQLPKSEGLAQPLYSRVRVPIVESREDVLALWRGFRSRPAGFPLRRERHRAWNV